MLFDKASYEPEFLGKALPMLAKSKLQAVGGGGQGGENPGVMGAGGLREAGEEGAGGGISKKGGTREK